MPKGRRSPATRLAKEGHKLPSISANSAIYGDTETEAPENVASDPYAMECWERTVRTLIANGTWQPADRHAVQRYAIATAACCHCEKEVLNTNSLIQTTKTGYTAVGAPLVAWSKAAKVAEAAEKQLGLSVDARRALSLSNTPEADEFDSWMAENK